MYQSLGEYTKAEEYEDKVLAIMKEIDDRKGEALADSNQAAEYLRLGEYTKAEK